MYGRRLGDRVLSFGHEGLLYRRSFVMYDRQTHSLWVHTMAQAVKGPLRGTRLPILPSSLVPWSAWRAAHPDTLVLAGQPARGFMGRFDAARAPERYGLSLQPRDAPARLYPYRALQKRPVVNDRWHDRPLVVVFDPATSAAAVFDRTVGGRTLHFAALPADRDGRARMRDTETGSVWLRLSGVCVSGPRAGQHLRPVPAIPWRTDRWAAFFPNGSVFSP
ncbi:MAG: DUF3179 domain-containing protein [Planctomycetota bacterium]|nr:MAG: DUF3179 domain-containing protein [Planctomycetota bacterium]